MALYFRRNGGSPRGPEDDTKKRRGCALILRAIGRSEEAIASLARVLLLDERFAYGFRHMGDLLATTGDQTAAQAAYQRAVAAADLY